jgi:peptide/nickel transport system substrate-binding protein
MKSLRWQILVVAITLIVVGVLLVTQQPGEQLFVPQPTEGGVYTEGLVGAISRLNPMLDLQNPADRDVDRLLFSGLVRFDYRGVPIPDLAAAWGNTPDGTIYNFSIRPDAVWHDGEPVTVDDVIFTIDMLKSEASAYPQDVKDLWNEVEIKKLDDKTVQFILPEPFAPFLDYATFPLIPKHLLGDVPPEQLASAEFNLAPVGTGPTNSTAWSLRMGISRAWNSRRSINTTWRSPSSIRWSSTTSTPPGQPWMPTSGARCWLSAA